jgi:hypothetical protein
MCFIWEDKIKSCLKQIGWKGVDWIYLIQNGDHWRALVNTGRNFQFS